MDIRKAEIAPITEGAWTEIEQQAHAVLSTQLSARTLVDVDGPHGFDFSCSNVGRLTEIKTSEFKNVAYGVRRVQPLVEVRIPFELDIWELDNVARGARDTDLEAVRQAAAQLVKFEEDALYYGLPEASITGLISGSSQQALPLRDSAELPEIVAHAVQLLRESGNGGPHVLVLEREAYRQLAGDVSNYPPRERIAHLVSNVIEAPTIRGGAVVSASEGHFTLCLGQDASVGFEGRADRSVRLFLTETFTFHMDTPEGVVPLKRRD